MGSIEERQAATTATSSSSSSSSSSSMAPGWPQLLQRIKTSLGASLDQSVLVTKANAVAVAGRRAGCLAVVAGALSPELLQNALEQYAGKLQEDRGF